LWTTGSLLAGGAIGGGATAAGEQLSVTVAPAPPKIDESFTLTAETSGFDASIDRYEWDFSDPSGDCDSSWLDTTRTGQTVKETLLASVFDSPLDPPEEAPIEVTLTVTAADGTTATTSRTITWFLDNEAPIAALDVTVRGGPDGVVEFDGTPTRTDDSIRSYDWELNDIDGDYSETLSGPFPSKAIPKQREYEITLSVTDNYGETDQTRRAFSTYNGTAPPEVLAGNTYKLLNRQSGRALDIAGSATANGANAQLWDSYEGANQLWRIEAAEDGSYTLLNVNSGKALDVSAASGANGAAVHQWEDVGAENQQWYIEQVEPGIYTLTARHSGKALEASGFTASNGTTVQQWGYGGGPTQQWVIVPVDWTYVPAITIDSHEEITNPDGTRTLGATVTNERAVPVSVNPSLVPVRSDPVLNPGQEDILLEAEETRRISITFVAGDVTEFDLSVGTDRIQLVRVPYDPWEG
jgi:hypothetical protein